MMMKFPMIVITSIFMMPWISKKVSITTFHYFMMRAIGFNLQGPTCTLRKDHWKTELLQKIQSNGGDYWMKRPQEKKGRFCSTLAVA